MECKKCSKKEKKIKELKEVMANIHKKKKMDEKYLKFMIADVLRSLNGCDINAARKKLKNIGGVQQYHNYPAIKMPIRPNRIWYDGEIY